MDIRHIRDRLALFELEQDLARIRALTERHLRESWAPAPPERARLCRLPACRRHGACRSDQCRRACAPACVNEPAQAPNFPTLSDGLPPRLPAPPLPEPDRPQPDLSHPPVSHPVPEPVPDRETPPPIRRETSHRGYWPADLRPTDDPPFGEEPLPHRPAPFVTADDFAPPARIAPLPRLRILD